MPDESASTRPASRRTKRTPPLRIWPSDEQILTELHQKTGLSRSELILRCIRHAVPRFLSGEANLLDYPPEHP